MYGLIVNKEKMGKYEIEKKLASYKTIVDYFVGDIVLCNNIVNVDSSVWDNMEVENDEEYIDIYQWFICNVNEHDKELAKHYGLIFSYSDMLGCDVLCVDHFGTSWDYVLTDCELFDTWEELEKYNEECE